MYACSSLTLEFLVRKDIGPDGANERLEIVYGTFKFSQLESVLIGLNTLTAIMTVGMTAISVAGTISYMNCKNNRGVTG